MSAWKHIDNNQGPIENCHYNQVRGACGEGLLPPRIRRDSQDSGDNANIGRQD